ncbi:carboxymuconolactone decarboxylase family protein [Pokkaliibacter sp. MBI-7]|uniref:carboxymuconolactone decarboxylase family protein n=1 Tax=Pokkaliibacter sp. MBI-7 TaxID=3040600 RepID=UPI002447FE6F|nr:carboxymuconolactone decarboxylase family protein [Pokkaliibacter sp. MBI-7]MDH2431397.1 carboxymuconolactone decarboxylase family protein [Pokkaliibacter sp. MBI-7]
MSNTSKPKTTKSGLAIGAMTLALGLGELPQAAHAQQQDSQQPATAVTTADTLTRRQQAIIPVAAYAAAGDMPGLQRALNEGLDAGLTISEAKEVLLQLYAYAGFPRSLNALAELMKVVEARKQQGINDAPGREPGKPIPQGEALLAAGTANQTRLAGAPVGGPLFDFAPAANEFLRSHLFGDIFERDNLDWQSRELATVGMLSAIAGAEPQLQAHIRISMNTGLTAAQLQQLGNVLADRTDSTMASRAREALARHLATLSQ